MIGPEQTGPEQTGPGFEKFARAERFVHAGVEVDEAANTVTCRYRFDGGELGGYAFTETVHFPAGGDWAAPGVAATVRLLYLLTGVSYYKAAAAPVLDLGDLALTPAEREFLRGFYLDGLGEYAYRNGFDLGGLELRGPLADPEPGAGEAPRPGVVVRGEGPARPLVPFGGGVDSIVSVELLRERAAAGESIEPTLFVVNRPGDRFDAIEAPAAVTGLPVLRAERTMDEQILRSAQLGFHNGHVPVTGVISAIGLVAAALNSHDAVVMSNEWSASSATLVVAGRAINHQYSKSEEFENALRAQLAAHPGAPDYFSLLRPFTELWIARRFAAAPQYFDTFRSCNRAFLIDPARRAAQWCGECDKCAFIDLILAPFVGTASLEKIFAGREPLARVDALPAFRTLLALTPDAKPWECVGDESECRVAARLAAARPDRQGSPVLTALLAELEAGSDAGTFTDPEVEALLRPVGGHVVPERYAPAELAR